MNLAVTSLPRPQNVDPHFSASLDSATRSLATAARGNGRWEGSMADSPDAAYGGARASWQHMRSGYNDAVTAVQHHASGVKPGVVDLVNKGLDILEHKVQPGQGDDFTQAQITELSTKAMHLLSFAADLATRPEGARSL